MSRRTAEVSLALALGFTLFALGCSGEPAPLVDAGLDATPGFDAPDVPSDWELEPPDDLMWQVQFGGDGDQGSTYGNESLLGLVSDGAGGVIAFSDRRFRSDPNGPFALLYRVDGRGELSGVARLEFESQVTPTGLRRGPDDSLILATDIDDLSLLRFDASGAILWSRAYDREPYAFGGLALTDFQVDAAGGAAIVGNFDPSEQSDTLGFVMRASETGEPLWMRSWRTTIFQEDASVAIAPGGTIAVMDSLPAMSGASGRVPSVIAFAPDGTPIAQRVFLRAAFDGPVGAFSKARIASDGGEGFVVLGLSGASRDGVLELYISTLRLDADLALQSERHVLVPLKDTVRTGPIELVSDGAGGLLATLPIDAHMGVSTFDSQGVLTMLYALTSSTRETPFLEDDDFPLLIAPSAEGTVIVGGTVDTPGGLRHQPWPFHATSAAIDLVAPGESVFEDTIFEDTVLSLAGPTFTITADELTLVNTPLADDEDVVLMRSEAP